MTLLGQGIITIWNDIAPLGLDTFYAWHENEHIAERVAIEGFLRGRRYIATDAEVRWFTLYEARSPEVLAGSDYLARLNAPTPWTKEAVAHFTNVTRGLTRRTWSQARGDGAELLAWGFAGDAAAIAGLGARLTGDVLPALFARHDIAGVHWCETDRAASTVETAEKRGRAGGTLVPDAVVMVESSRIQPLAEASRLIKAALEGVPGIDPLGRAGLYRLEFQRLD